MTSWQLARLVAGSLFLLLSGLSIFGSPISVSPWLVAFTAFVGANLLQSSLTKGGLMDTIMRKPRARPGA